MTDTSNRPITTAEAPYPDGPGGMPPQHTPPGIERPGWPVVAIIAVVVVLVAVIVASSDGDGSGGTQVATGGEETETEDTADDDAGDTTGDTGGDVGGSAPITGDHTAIVVSLQNDLTLLGYYGGEASGVYDEATQDALSRFQSDQSLQIDGRYSGAVDVAIQTALVELGATTETVELLQTMLANLGWYDGPIDGDYGPGTTAAVQGLQTTLGITADGIVGPQTIVAFENQCAAEPARCASAGEGQGGAEPTTGFTVRLVLSDGLDQELDVVECTSTGENDLVLQAQLGAAVDFSVNAAAGTGAAEYASADGLRQGSVESVVVGADGTITANGSIAAADGSETPATFTLTGICG